MLQLALLAVSVCLVILGIKGFSSSGLAVSKTRTLTGTPAKIADGFCILGGLSLIPLLFLILWATSR